MCPYQLIFSSSFTPQSVEKELQKEGSSAEKLAAKKVASTKKVADIEVELSKLDFSETEYDSLGQQKTELEAAVTELTERVDTLQAQLNGRLGFQYSDPVRGFDRSKVKGLVAKLIEVKDSKHATALEWWLVVSPFKLSLTKQILERLCWTVANFKSVSLLSLST